MHATSLKLGSETELRGLLEAAVDSIGETLSSLIGREIKVQRRDLQLQDAASVLAGLPRRCAVARGAMEQQYEGRTFVTAFELPDAITLAGLLMMTPDDEVARRREADELTGEDAEAFGEIGTVLYSGFANVLGKRLEGFDVRMQDRGVLEPGRDPDELLGDGRLVTLGFAMKVGEHPESIGLVAIDAETAERWHGGPLEPTAGGGSDDDATTASGAARADDEGLAAIPAAPIRGVLSSFVVQGDVYPVLRRSCRRVGLELRRHGRGEIPNPAAHKNQIVVLDVPHGEERRFDWCRRIKELSESTKVVLLIRHPSRQRVTQAFLSRADAILGFPCEEPQLSQKLEALVPELSPDDAAPPAADE